MFAVVRTDGKQYRVATDDKIIVEKIDGEAGASVQLETLMFGDAGTITTGGKVTAEIVANRRRPGLWQLSYRPLPFSIRDLQSSARPASGTSSHSGR